MPKVPLHHFTPQRTGPSTVQGNTAMFNREHQAAARLGAEIRGAADQLSQFTLRKQEAINFAAVTDAERQMKEGWLLFQDEMATEGDESKWTDAWQKRSNQIVKDIGVDKLSPAAQQRLNPVMADWRATTGQRVNQAATVRQIERSKVEVQQSAEADLRMGDIASYETKIREGAVNGLFEPAEEARLLKDGARRADVYAATNLILNDPIAAKDALLDKTDGGRWREFKELDETDRKSLVDSANVAVQKARTETYQGLIDRMNAGEVIGSAELDTLVDAKLLNPSQAKTIKANQQKGSITEASSRAFAETLSAINAYDPSRDPDNSKYADLMVSVMGLPPGMKEDATARLKDKGDRGSPLNTTPAKEAFGYVDQAFKYGLYGDYQKRFMVKGQWVTKIDPEVYQTALARKVRIEDALTDFIRANPNATRTDLQKFVADQNAEDIVKAGAVLFAEPAEFDAGLFSPSTDLPASP